MPASLIREIVTEAAPLVTMSPSTGETMPMSLARMDRTGPASVGQVGVVERREAGHAALDQLLDHEVGRAEPDLGGAGRRCCPS